MNGGYLKSAVHDWAETYDWFAAQDRMNAYEHFKVHIDGVPIQFKRIPGKGPNPSPLILTHGWPWSFWDMHKMIGPLTDPAAHGGDPTDAFELIIPSVPGFTLSTPVPKAGVNFWKTADLGNKLMTEVLGFPKYFAAGGDWGYFITQQLGHKYAKNLHGIFITNVAPLDLLNAERYWDISNTLLNPNPTREQRKPLMALMKKRVPHVALHTIEPQSFAYAMHDSRVGLLAWLIQSRRDWGHWEGDFENTFPREHLLTTATLYWLTNCFVNTARYYADAARDPWVPSHDRSPRVEAPTGVIFLAGEFWPGMTMENRVELFKASPTGASINIHYTNVHPRGGISAIRSARGVHVRSARRLSRSTPAFTGVAARRLQKSGRYFMRKVWFITGATRGIGAEIVSAALDAGDRVAATARNTGPLALELPPDRFIALPLDVTDSIQAEAAVAGAVAQFGGIDVLVNNAGYGQLGIFEENTPEDVEAQFATNVFGLFNVTRAVLPVMRQQRAGHLINLSSVAGFRGPPSGSLFAASKFAVEGFSESLAAELAAFNIRVTIVEPGFIRTDFLDSSLLRYGKAEIADYAELSQKLKTAYGAHNHLQSGNPAKLAKAMVEITRHSNPPLRLPMGSDAVSVVSTKLEAMRAELETWRETSVSSDGFDPPKPLTQACIIT